MHKGAHACTRMDARHRAASGSPYIMAPAQLLTSHSLMKFTLVAMAALAAAQDVACRINGQEIAIVDLDTGLCPFPIPLSAPVNFKYNGPDDYLADAYYLVVDAAKIFNDIVNAGRSIDVPAKALFDQGNFPLFHIHEEKTPELNSTEALRKRFGLLIVKKDDQSDFVAFIKLQDGAALPLVDVDVVVPENATTSEGAGTGASATASGTTTVTDVSTKIITVTSCSDHKCATTTTPATLGPVTTTVEGTETVYTTWCPVSETTVTDVSTKIVTITSCADNKCHEATVPATLGPVTTTVAGTETVYTTWCPVAEETTTKVSTKIVTITSCVDNKCHETTVPATLKAVPTTVAGESTVLTTWVPSTPVGTGVPPAPVAPGETATTEYSTQYVTVTCHEEKCQPHTVQATWGPTTVTVDKSVTVYTTWCPVAAPSGAAPAPGAPGAAPAAPGAAPSGAAPAAPGAPAPAAPSAAAPAPGAPAPAAPSAAAPNAPGAPAPSPAAPGAPAPSAGAPGAPAPASAAPSVVAQGTTLSTSAAPNTVAAISTAFAGAAARNGAALFALALPFAYLI